MTRMSPIYFNGLDPRPGKATYDDIGGPGGHLACRRPFRGNSLFAHVDERTGDYVVMSYNTEIARVNPAGEIVYFNDRKYSQTTTYHQTVCRSWL